MGNVLFVGYEYRDSIGRREVFQEAANRLQLGEYDAVVVYDMTGRSVFPEATRLGSFVVMLGAALNEINDKVRLAFSQMQISAAHIGYPIWIDFQQPIIPRSYPNHSFYCITCTVNLHSVQHELEVKEAIANALGLTLVEY